MDDGDFVDRSGRRQHLDRIRAVQERQARAHTQVATIDRAELAGLRRELVELGFPTYILIRDGRWIHCTVCGLASPHPDDVRFRFCARCDAFHDNGEH